MRRWIWIGSVGAAVLLFIASPTLKTTDPGRDVDRASVQTTASGLETHQTNSAHSALVDCDIPFSQLRQLAPSCTRERAQPGRRCEMYSSPEFPEVTSIVITRPNVRQTICTGTLIAPGWVLSAAHCFIGDDRAIDHGATAAGLSLVTDNQMQIDVTAPNAGTDQKRRALSVIVHPNYTGFRASDTGQVPYDNDLAVIALDRPYSSDVQPAALAAQDAFNQFSTIAGYGFSNADGGTIGAFQLAWPVPLTHVGDELRFTAVDEYGNRSTFCQGDSGGPVFADRVRGCRTTDKVPEKRPREIQGTMSYIQRLGKPPEHATSEPEQHAETCRQAEYDVMQSITPPGRRTWICSATGQQALGCRTANAKEN